MAQPQSKEANDQDYALMTAAMAMRVKYRTHKTNFRQDVPVRSLGTNKGNRGTVYPSGIRCKSLCLDVLPAGFLKEEVNHVCVVVEEPCGANAPKGYESASSYNARKSSADELLATCFESPYDKVSHTMLAHNHVMLVLRAFLTKAAWNLDEIPNVIKFCDAEGRLSIAAVAERANGKELAEMMAEGINCEVLTFQMEIEEPKAATTISEALNHPNTLAMRTSELTAVAVLKGEIIVQLSKDLSQQVAWETVRDNVVQRLKSVADDPDLPQLFDWLINSGVGTNTFVDDFMAWTEVYVDSSKRRLRLGAWGVVNGVVDKAKWTRIAILKRSYRRKPTLGYCPSPENIWTQIPWAALEPLEDILRYFHVGYKAWLDRVTPQSRIPLLANVDIAAADAFLNAKDCTVKFQTQKEAPPANKWILKVKKALLDATHKYSKALPQMKNINCEDDRQAHILFEEAQTARASWIQWPQEETQASAKNTAVAEPVAPRVIIYNEITGARQNQQLDFKEQTEKQGKKMLALPWRDWSKGVGIPLGSVEAHRAAAVAVLHSLHALYPVTEECLDVWGGAANKRVTATEKMEACKLMLPPCIPKQMKLISNSVNPHAAKIVVNENACVEGVPSRHSILKTATFFAHPEWQEPTKPSSEPSRPTAAVAEDDADTSADDIDWDWSKYDQITMHPYWAVRRLTATQLGRQVLQAKLSGMFPLPRFNLKVTPQMFSNVCVGTVNSKLMNFTRLIEVPFLTNSCEVEKDEELILEVHESTKKTKESRTWMDAFKDQETERKKMQEEQKVQQKKANTRQE